MNTAAAAFSPSTDPVELAFRAALAEIVQAGVVVARVAGKLAAAEEQAVDALAHAATVAAAAMTARPESLEAANEAGRLAELSDLSRDRAIERLVSIVDAYERAARAVRRTVALARRLEDGRPLSRPRAPEGRATGLRHAAEDTPPEPADRLDSDVRAEMDPAERFGDETAGLSVMQVVRLIARDLRVTLPPEPEPESGPESGEAREQARAQALALQAYSADAPERIARLEEWAEYAVRRKRPKGGQPPAT